MSLIVIIRPDANIKFKVSVILTCQYINKDYDVDCDELPIDAGSKFCIFHDINYLKGNNYDKHKEEVAKRFEKKLSKYSSNHIPLKFIGYFLPEISFQDRQFTEDLYFSYVTFYGTANFTLATFSREANFSRAKFSGLADFDSAKCLQHFKEVLLIFSLCFHYRA